MTILGFKITVFRQKWWFRGANLITSVNICEFGTKIVEHISVIICILSAAKSYTNNFTDTPFGPDYFTYSSLTEPSNQPYFQFNFKIFRSVGTFFITFIQFVLKHSEIWNLLTIKSPNYCERNSPFLSIKSQIKHHLYILTFCRPLLNTLYLYKYNQYRVS